MKRIEERLLPAIEWLRKEWEARESDHIVIDEVPSVLPEKRKIYFTLMDDEGFADETIQWSLKASDLVTAAVLSYDKREGRAEKFFSDDPDCGATGDVGQLIISFEKPDIDDDEDYF